VHLESDQTEDREDRQKIARKSPEMLTSCASQSRRTERIFNTSRKDNWGARSGIGNPTILALRWP
jgi:hypothetical protein